MIALGLAYLALVTIAGILSHYGERIISREKILVLKDESWPEHGYKLVTRPHDATTRQKRPKRF
jgi:hypothetical protein